MTKSNGFSEVASTQAVNKCTASLSLILHLSSTAESRGVNISNRALFICNVHGVGELELSVSAIDSFSKLDVELNSTEIKQ